MTQTELLARLRANLDEVGITDGLYNDANHLYKFIDTAQNELIDRMYALTKLRRRMEKFFEYDALKVLKVTVLFNIATGTVDYTFSGMSITNFRHPYDLQLGYTDGQPRKGATLSNQAEMDWKNSNDVMKPTTEDPLWRVELNTKLVILPYPVANSTSGGAFTYYKTPLTVSSSQDLTLPVETHEAILFYSTALALKMDKLFEDANSYMDMYEDKFKLII